MTRSSGAQAERTNKARCLIGEGDLLGAGRVLCSGGGLTADDEVLAVHLGEDVQDDDPALAAELFGLAAEYTEAHANWNGAAAARQRQVVAFAAVGDTHAALRAAAAARAVVERLDDDDDRLTHLSNLAIGLKEAGLRPLALDLLGEVIQRRRGQRDDDTAGGVSRVTGLAAALLNAATCQIDGGDPRAALPLLDEVERLLREHNELIRLGNVLINRAVAFSRLGRPGDARQAYVDAAATYRAGGAGPSDQGYAKRGEAATLAVVGRCDEAIEAYAAAVELFEQAGDMSEQRRTQIGLVMARASRGDQIEAAEFSRLAASLDRSPLIDRAQMAMNLGNVALNQGDVAAAELFYHRSRRAFGQLGWPGEAARVDLSRAVAARRAGRLDRARRLISAARRVFVAEERWLNVAHADHNSALVLREQAQTTDPPSPARLRLAMQRSLAAVAEVDRYRHSLPTSADRGAVLAGTYPGFFATAINLCLNLGRAEVAALIERTRVQPVLQAPSSARGAFADPPPITARRSVPPVGGTGAPVVLADQAEALVGPGGRWIGWWRSDRQLVRADSASSRVAIEVTDFDAVALTRLSLALAVTTELDLRAADGEAGLAARLALWRAARGPLLADAALSARLADTLPRRSRMIVESALVDTGVVDLDSPTLLWPLSQLLFGRDPLATVTATRGETGEEDRARLILAPPPLLGRIPWAALPLAAPAVGAVPRLIDCANIMIGLPAALTTASVTASSGSDANLDAPTADDRTLALVDPLGDLRAARRLNTTGRRLGHGHDRAVRPTVLTALEDDVQLLVAAAHIRPGEEVDPASTAILLPAAEGGVDPLTAADLAAVGAPRTCVLLGCDGAGAATGTEWTGVATGLVWAGARRIVTTTWPVVDDARTTRSDDGLLRAVQDGGAARGLWRWQRDHSAAHGAAPDNADHAAYRWAGTVVVGVTTPV